MTWLNGKNVLLGITGGIAAYKACDLVRELTKDGAEVNVVMTKAAQEFITPLTLQTLSRNPVVTELFNLISESRIGHISLAQKADLLLVAPATANIIGKFASGIADDMLSTLYLATTAPVLLAPAMNEKMYLHPVVRRNIEKLKALGVHFVDPEKGELACGDEGIGRLASVDRIAEMVRIILSEKVLSGKKILVTAGPTCEPLDPVRELTNRSSGKMGYAIAKVARRLGGDVTLISGPVALEEPHYVETVGVRTAREMLSEIVSRIGEADLLIMAAAVADFRPTSVSERKIKKDSFSMTLELEKNVDILREVVKNRGRTYIVGFAAETDDVVSNAVEKLRSKGMDAIFANDVSRKDVGFSSDYNEGMLIFSDGSSVEFPRMTKEEVALRMLKTISERLGEDA